jgi:hypothetical protein
MKAVKDAHDDLLVKVYRAQADALIIESQAKSRLADEYDAAQERGEISKQGAHVGDHNMSTADLGLRKDGFLQARARPKQPMPLILRVKIFRRATEIIFNVLKSQNFRRLFSLSHI